MWLSSQNVRELHKRLVEFCAGRLCLLVWALATLAENLLDRLDDSQRRAKLFGTARQLQRTEQKFEQEVFGATRACARAVQGTKIWSPVDILLSVIESQNK